MNAGMNNLIKTSNQADARVKIKRNVYYAEMKLFYKKNSVIKPWKKGKITQITQALLRMQKKGQSAKKGDELEMFEILNVNNERLLIKKRTNIDRRIMCVVPYKQTFDIIKHAHENCKHGARNETRNALIDLQCWVPWEALDVYINCCVICKENTQVNIDVGSKCFFHRGRFSLIDFRARPDGEFNWLLYYKDLLTEFIHLRPLKSNAAAETSQELLKIFMQFGAPEVLENTNNNTLSTVIEHLESLWPACKIVNGFRCPAVVNTDDDDTSIYFKITYWLDASASTDWSYACNIVEKEENYSQIKNLTVFGYNIIKGEDVECTYDRNNMAEFNSCPKKVTRPKRTCKTLISSVHDVEDEPEFIDINEIITIY